MNTSTSRVSQVPSSRDTPGKEQVNVRLTGIARKKLSNLAQKLGISQADVLELLLREDQVELEDRAKKKLHRL